jgi:hypothetical protein
MPGFKALRRSWTLSREGRWRVALTFFLLFVLGWSVSYGVQSGWHWLVLLIYREWPRSLRVLRAIYLPAGYALSVLLGMVLQPLYPIAVTLLYYDQRIRKEGFDIEHMMTAAGMDAAADPTLAHEESGTGELASVPVEGAGA